MTPSLWFAAGAVFILMLSSSVYLLWYGLRDIGPGSNRGILVYIIGIFVLAWSFAQLGLLFFLT